MSKYGFLDALDKALAKDFTYDYEINWDKKNHAVEIFYLLDVENPGVAVTDTEDDAEASSENISFEDAVVFYNPTKSKIAVEDYLASFPYEPKKGLSQEFITYFVAFLQETADNELDALTDFLNSDEAEFAGTFNLEAFEKGLASLTETTFFVYPRY
ncbi:MAG: DUF3013 family protein [Lactococcus raffinolactis]|jgi:hypothetical protein|nr:DUF3013 family protein [Chryseobacterium sp.]MDN5473308.1 DUF3013 family protein [Lactococcus raffinolactis]MDN5488505.1 DUF3013 family protein [Lactococcus lactis]MDN6030622.1 DUF3013 family protein [Lactococcus plantarum]MDN6194783.1 DUF3013 family protein [Alkalibacterium sp.]